MSNDPRSFWRDWAAETWQHSKDQFAWWHPFGTAVVGFLFQWFRQDWVRAAVALWENAQTAGLAVVAWATVVLVVHAIRSLPRIYERRLSEIRDHELKAGVEGLPIEFQFRYCFGVKDRPEHHVVLANRSNRALSLEYWYIVDATNPETMESVHWTTPDLEIHGLSEQVLPGETQRGRMAVPFQHAETYVIESPNQYLHIRDRISGRTVQIRASGRYVGGTE